MTSAVGTGNKVRRPVVVINIVQAVKCNSTLNPWKNLDVTGSDGFINAGDFIAIKNTANVI
jgi:hypothetical protein